MNKNYQIYVDGSSLDGSSGYGVVILEDGNAIAELSGSVPAEFIQGTNQIAGELLAIEKAVEWCQGNSIQEVSIFYDYMGIERWASGEWKTNHPLTQRYVDFIQNSGISIHWHKVDSHKGDQWNNRADELAKSGAKNIKAKSEEELAGELENKANGFLQFLIEHGYKAKLKGIYQSNCAKIEIKDIGYINIYHTKKIDFSPRYHELKDKSCEWKLESLWQEYHNGKLLFPA